MFFSLIFIFFRNRTNEDKLCLILNAISMEQRNRVTELLNSFSAINLYRSLVQYWAILFDTTKVKRTGKYVTTFSELTESYLLLSSNRTIQTVLLATLKNLIVDTNALNIELILKLFMDYLATHFGQMNAYVNAQSILENMLEAYFYRLYVVRGYCESLSSTSHEAFTKSNKINGQLKSTNFSSNNNLNGKKSTAHISNRLPSHICSDAMDRSDDSLCSQTSTSSEKSNLSASIGGNTNSDNSSKSSDVRPTGKRVNGSTSVHMKTVTSPTITNDDTARKNHQMFNSSFHAEAFKILIRIYLGSLKTYTATHCDLVTVSNTEKLIQLKYVKFLRENFNKIYANHMQAAVNQYQYESFHPMNESNGKWCSNFDKIMQNDGINGENMKDGDVHLPKTPILFLSRRLSYLNCMPPIGNDEYFKESISTSVWWSGDFDCDNDERRKAIVTVLKIQVCLNKIEKKFKVLMKFF